MFQQYLISGPQFPLVRFEESWPAAVNSVSDRQQPAQRLRPSFGAAKSFVKFV
jgi:hypothetical protein